MVISVASIEKLVTDHHSKLTAGNARAAGNTASIPGCARQSQMLDKKLYLDDLAAMQLQTRAAGKAHHCSDASSYAENGSSESSTNVRSFLEEIQSSGRRMPPYQFCSHCCTMAVRCSSGSTVGANMLPDVRGGCNQACW